jgi:uracil-DNA glycosylase
MRRRRALDQLRAAMLACRRCPALVRCRSRVVPGHGATSASVAFVGLAPGRLGGDRTGIPFSGDRSGELLRRMIRETGLHRVFITNLVRCNPRDARGRNRDPSAREIANCRSHLHAELDLVRPAMVACLGRLAWRELAGRDATFDPHHRAIVNVNGLRLFAMYHPGYVIRGAYPMEKYARDFARLAAMIDSIGSSGDARKRWTLHSSSSAPASNAPVTLPTSASRPRSSLRSRSTSRC